MGVPKFYRWMSERYPCLNQVVRESEIPEFDNLYLDMNGIIHACSHPHDEDIHFRISEEVMIKDIFKYLECLFNIIKPRKLFFMAVDGVAPRAKMNQQRGRRFRSARDALTREKDAQNRGEVLPQEARFDSNCITPGTDFMVKLQKHLEYFVASKVSSDELWKNVQVILSGHETPGEGEHKIMDFIRAQRSEPNYDPNTRHCLYGLDADLVMLGMCSHEPYFTLLREEVKFRRKKEKEATFHINPEAINFLLLHLSLLRDYIDHEFSPLKKVLPFQYNLENIIDDWALMGFLCGNDFIPHLPHFHIGKNALATLYSIYMEVLPECDGYLNEAGKLNLKNFQKFLTKLSQIDLENFSELSADLKYLESKSSNFKRAKKLVKYEECEGVEGEALEPEKEEANLIELCSEGTSDLDEEDDDEEELAVSDADAEDDTLEDEFKMHKRDYYRTKMNYADVTPEVLKEQAYCYIKAIQWNLYYYYEGCPSWSWYYPHHYAPYISDVKSFENIDLTFDLGQPFKPYEQLLGVLPAASREFLPKPYQKLVTDENSPLKDYYPEDFDLDLNGKINSWEAVVVIPFIDENKLLDAARSCESQLSEKEKIRNCHGPHLMFTYSRELQPPVHSTLPGVLPDIDVNHAKLTPIPKDAYRLSSKQIKKGLLEGVDLECYNPGFPTLRTMPHTSRLQKANIRVFEMPSSGLSIVLELTPKPEKELNEILEEYLGKEVFINWPILVNAKVVKVCDGEKIFSLNSTGQQVSKDLSEKEQRDCSYQVKHAREALKSRKGIILYDFDVILFCKPLTGCKYNVKPNGQVSLEKQWSPSEQVVPLPMVLKDIPVRVPSYQKTKSLEELFPIGSKCFILNEQYYGDMASIIETQNKTSKVKVEIQRVAEPDLTEIKNRVYDLMSKEYMTNHALAQRLALNPCVVSRLTGTVIVLKSNGERVNIGLNLKFNSRREYVPGYSKKRDETWLFSRKVLKLMEDYNTKFPELFINLSKLADQKCFQPDQIFEGSNAEEKVTEVGAWLKKLPHQSLRRMKFDAECLDECVVKCIEDLLSSHKVFGNTYEPVSLIFSTNQLYRPSNIIGHAPPDPNATFSLFDRVVNVREGISVPLGARGVVIGKIKSKQDDNTFLCDVVFDEPFIGGLALNCAKDRGYRLHPFDLINISFKKKKGGYGVREDFDMTPIQPGRIENRDRRIQLKFSQEPKKLANVSQTRNHERNHDYTKRNVDYNSPKDKNLQPPFYHEARRRNESAPIEINHSSKSLFQNPKEHTSLDDKNFQFIWNHLKIPNPNGSISLEDKNNYRSNWNQRESSIPKGRLVENISHQMSTGTSPPSKSRSITAAELLKFCKTLEQEREESGYTARAKLKEWCIKKFGKEPDYTMSRLGPNRTLILGKVVLPDNRDFTLPSNPCIPKDDIYEKCALKALNELGVSVDSSSFPKHIDPPTDLLPLPPLNWVEKPVQKDEQPSIPTSFVTANKMLLNSSNARPNITNHEQQEKKILHHFPHQQQQHQQYFNQCFTINCPTFKSGPHPREGPFLTNPLTKHSSSSHSRSRPLQQQQPESVPQPSSSTSTNKFVPLQVTRNNQAPRESNKQECQIKQSPSSRSESEKRTDQIPTDGFYGKPFVVKENDQKRTPNNHRKNRILASFNNMSLKDQEKFD